MCLRTKGSRSMSEWRAVRSTDGHWWNILRDLPTGGLEYLANTRMAARRFTKREAHRGAAEMNGEGT